MHLNQYLLGVVTLVEICTTVVAPVLEHSELDSFVCHYIQNFMPGEVGPNLEVFCCLYHHSELL